LRFELKQSRKLVFIQAIAARHGDSFFWSFAQKMVPRPDGSEVMFQRKEKQIAKNRFQSFS
jgi:hypothetical protein